MSAFQRMLVCACLVALGLAVPAGSRSSDAPPPFPLAVPNSDVWPAWSPDDRQIAYMTLPAGPLFVIPSEGGSSSRMFEDGHQYTTPAWSPDGKRLAFTSDRGGTWAVWSSRPDGSDPQAVAATPLASVYAPAWSPDGSRLLYSAVAGAMPRVMVADVTSATRGTRVIDGWRPRWSPNGRWIAYTDRFRESGRDLEAIAVCAPDGTAARRLRSVVVPVQSPHLAADWSPDGTRLVVSRRTASGSELLAVDPEKDTATVMARVSGYAHDPAWSHDGTRIAYSSVTSDHPGEIHVVSVSGGIPVALTHQPRGVGAHPVEVPTEGGARLPAWLYTPPSPGRHAAIVWVHGGWPGEANIGDDYDRSVQYFVGQGYAVLAPNFHGSVGYTEELAHVNSPSQVIADLVASGRYLRSLPSIDPNRVGILGMSGGGFWTTLTIGAAPTAFAAAVDFFGPTDLVEFRRTVPLARTLLEGLLGPYEEHETAYRDASPIAHVERVAAPVLVIHGDGDQVIPVEQSIRFVDALRAAGKPVEFVRLRGGHGFSGKEEATAYEATARFFSTHLRAEPREPHRATMRHPLR